MYAVVVVDIPDIKHKGFDYLIPEKLIPTLKVGCRVVVPLGPRLVQGFVIKIKRDTDFKTVKEIKESLDIVPAISYELVQLADHISSYYSAHLYRSLQILIPVALKSKIKEYVLINTDTDENKLLNEEKIIYDWIKRKESVQLPLLLDKFIEYKYLIQQMFEDGVLELNKDFKNKGSRKIVTYVKLSKSFKETSINLQNLPQNAKKQKDILQYFLKNSIKEIEYSILKNKLAVTMSPINSLNQKGFLEIQKIEVDRDPYKERSFPDKKVELSSEQKEIVREIIISIDLKLVKPFLIHGVTGSGKTEIYLEIIEYVLNQGKDSIVLVPEISLTAQMVERFKGRFGKNVAVLHSRLSKGEKLDEWLRIQRGEAKIVIGARSAIFAPVKRLGLVVIDEEHEATYKQEEYPKYHAREIANWRIEYNKAQLILGSATPSLESYYKAKNKEYHLLELPNRVMNRLLPETSIVDMREELMTGNNSMFSNLLREKIEEKLDKKEQIVLFLNRRGYSTFVMCRSCGYVIKCPHCDISLTYHHTNRVLRCHYCGYAIKEPKTCPECASKHIRYFGTGTQKVEEELIKQFPSIRVIRMDVDTTRKKGSHEKLINLFRKQEGDVLLGTQMIAKGLDFEKVTLVGVIAADTLLKLPDFRAAERTFQLVTQVSGRAGRHQLPGEVIIQTYNPKHYSIQCASRHDFIGFYEQELMKRDLLKYPPINNLIIVHFSHKEVKRCIKVSQMFVAKLKGIISSDVEILGPVVSPISRINDRNRFQCVIKYSNDTIIIYQINQIMIYIQDYFKDRQLQISVDVNPNVLM